MPKQRLELTWIGKGEEPQLEPRILIEDPEKSYGEAGSENMLIHGDNLLALKALEQEYAGKVKCIYIDPPYNTGSAFEFYEDGLEHSLWLQLIKQRLVILAKLLSEDGSIWISIDDNECHYLKVLCDEVFGRSNFVASVVWQKAYTSNQTARHISNTHDYVIVYAKELVQLSINKLSRTEEQEKKFKNWDNDPRGVWKAENLSAGKFYSAGQFPITGPTDLVFYPPKGRYWRCNEEQYNSWLKDDRITFGKARTGRPMLKKFLKEMTGGITPNTWWTHQEAGSNKSASIHVKKNFSDLGVFDTPKPEELLSRIFELATNPHDLVLDSFLGSGTTAAVAHKMGRRWIGIELGEHANTHCLPRLKKVVEGLDEGGITKAQNWKGGGGFKFYNLAPSLLRKDDLGQWVIDEAYNADQLAAAMAKHEGYAYAPDADRYWKQAYSTENDYLYTTTQLVTPATVDHILEQLGPEESLLICCKAYQAAAEARDPRINLHKIPASLTDRCEFGKDDYSLNIIDAPKDEDAPAFIPAGQLAAKEAEAEELRKYGKQKEMFD
jgi:adenine-specific DNA-methyltransferase